MDFDSREEEKGIEKESGSEGKKEELLLRWVSLTTYHGMVI